VLVFAVLIPRNNKNQKRNKRKRVKREFFMEERKLNKKNISIYPKKSIYTQNFEVQNQINQYG